jgi:predicted O-linked N-acetylglucosamine transferase (SPINDLY family)
MSAFAPHLPPQALNQRGLAFLDQGQADAALLDFDKAIAAQPGFAFAHNNRGRALVLLGREQEALESFEKALALDPALPDAFGAIAQLALNLCDWERVAAIAADLPRHIAQGANVPPFVLLGYSDDAKLQLQCASNDIAARFPSLPPLWRGERYRHGRIRLAYISSDFRQHAVAAQIADAIERHDRSGFEVIGIATTPDDGSALRTRLVRAFDQFHQTAHHDPQHAAMLIRQLEIDVLVDLNGHTDRDNFAVLAQRPAPVQAGWLGYAGTSGAPFLEWIIADSVVAPDASEFSEKIIRLPNSFFASDSNRPLATAPSRREAGLPELPSDSVGNGFVFCAFNKPWKITAPVFDIWMRLLQRVPGSVLWLKASKVDATLKQEAQARGVDPSRLVFAGNVAAGVHLARHQLAGLFLDTLPYNAHATACDALWAGLPVLTRKGNAFAARVAASLLAAAGLPELITDTAEDYEALALALARDPARLNALRDRLIANRASAPLFDTPRLARDLEAAYSRMLAAAV